MNPWTLLVSFLRFVVEGLLWPVLQGRFDVLDTGRIWRKHFPLPPPPPPPPPASTYQVVITPGKPFTPGIARTIILTPGTPSTQSRFT